MAKVSELERLKIRREELAGQSDQLRAELDIECGKLETPATVIETGHYYGRMALDAVKFAAPFSELFVKRKLTAIPKVWRNAMLGWQLWSRRNGRNR